MTRIVKWLNQYGEMESRPFVSETLAATFYASVLTGSRGFFPDMVSIEDGPALSLVETRVAS